MRVSGILSLIRLLETESFFCIGIGNPRPESEWDRACPDLLVRNLGVAAIRPIGRIDPVCLQRGKVRDCPYSGVKDRG